FFFQEGDGILDDLVTGVQTCALPIFPFTLAVTTDPVSGITDGLLKRPAIDPLVIEVDEELVFWQWKASLNVVDSLGDPIPIPKRSEERRVGKECSTRSGMASSKETES